MVPLFAAALVPLVKITLLAIVLCTIYFVSYTTYSRWLHPLAKYPGPWLASVTDLWQVAQFLSLKQPYQLAELHAKHGPVVRYGPDKISITHEEAIPAIYQGSSRMLPKTEFYDAFGGQHPNVFGTRDEAHHSVRRRHMSHAFSMTSIKDVERYLDTNIALLLDAISRECEGGRIFDLKELIHNYVIDVLGELAFSKSFDLQSTGDRSQIPLVKEHTLLASAMGSWPGMISTLKWLLPLLPIPNVQELFQGRSRCAQLASQCVQRRLLSVKFAEEASVLDQKPRKDLLTTLIQAKDPETGDRLKQSDLETEAFGFIIAGTHTTMATTTLLFWNLLQNPRSLEQCTTEIDSALPPLEPGQVAYPITNLEASLPYLRNCVKENFRLTPVFTMPLARRILQPEGLTIAGQHFPQGTSIAVSNHAFHHNPAVWGPSHNTFDPDRWNDPRVAECSRLLMHFGLGGRQCIGKTMALTNIYKVVVTLLRMFEFKPADAEDSMSKAGETAKMPPLISVGVSDLDGPLLVTAKPRGSVS